MRLLFLILFLSSWIFAQDTNIQGINPVNWGERIRLGTTFTSTDSTRLFNYNVSDSLYSGGTKDTLYSDALKMSGEDAVGIYRVTALAEILGDATGTLDSIQIDVRYGHNFSYYSTGVQNKITWESWNDIMVIDTDVLESLYISQSDCTWNNPAAFRQYRVHTTDADIDTVRPWLTDYLR